MPSFQDSMNIHDMAMSMIVMRPEFMQTTTVGAGPLRPWIAKIHENSVTFKCSDLVTTGARSLP